ncbi:hypothetical protein [Streptomyces sp. NPDC058394]|uniref:hypothetical protein n=1 Tax=Streptomyces sp. NPDC058394 TaxID=3346477 RepID=UPI0036529763
MLSTNKLADVVYAYYHQPFNIDELYSEKKAEISELLKFTMILAERFKKDQSIFGRLMRIRSKRTPSQLYRRVVAATEKYVTHKQFATQFNELREITAEYRREVESARKKLNSPAMNSAVNASEGSGALLQRKAEQSEFVSRFQEQFTVLDSALLIFS